MAVKIFIGNLSYGTDTNQLKELFGQYGVVTECDVLTGYGFVHMENEEVAKVAIKALSGSILNGSKINVELSTASTQGRAKLAARANPATKIFVGNLAKSTTDDSLRGLFETYGTVSEADVLGGFGFVHMASDQEAFKAIKALNGYILEGSRLNVELSTGGTQGKSKDRDVTSSRGSLYASRSRAPPSRYDPYPLPSPASRRLVPSYEPLGYPVPSGRPAGDSYTRDLLELYIKNRPAFDAYVNDPLLRKKYDLPPVEADALYARNPAPLTLKDYERLRLPDMPLPPSFSSPPLLSSIAADPYTSPSNYSAAYDALTSVSGRAWPGSAYDVLNAGPQASASARDRGHPYSPFD